MNLADFRMDRNGNPYGVNHMDEKKLNPKFPYCMEKAKWYIMFLLLSHIITLEEFDDLYSRLPEWAR